MKSDTTKTGRYAKKSCKPQFFPNTGEYTKKSGEYEFFPKTEDDDYYEHSISDTNKPYCLDDGSFKQNSFKNSNNVHQINKYSQKQLTQMLINDNEIFEESKDPYDKIYQKNNNVYGNQFVSVQTHKDTIYEKFEVNQFENQFENPFEEFRANQSKFEEFGANQSKFEEFGANQSKIEELGTNSFEEFGAQHDTDVLSSCVKKLLLAVNDEEINEIIGKIKNIRNYKKTYIQSKLLNIITKIYYAAYRFINPNDESINMRLGEFNNQIERIFQKFSKIANIDEGHKNTLDDNVNALMELMTSNELSPLSTPQSLKESLQKLYSIIGKLAIIDSDNDKKPYDCIAIHRVIYTMLVFMIDTHAKYTKQKEQKSFSYTAEIFSSLSHSVFFLIQKYNFNLDGASSIFNLIRLLCVDLMNDFGKFKEIASLTPSVTTEHIIDIMTTICPNVDNKTTTTCKANIIAYVYIKTYAIIYQLIHYGDDKKTNHYTIDAARRLCNMFNKHNKYLKTLLSSHKSKENYIERSMLKFVLFVVFSVTIRLECAIVYYNSGNDNIKTLTRLQSIKALIVDKTAVKDVVNNVDTFIDEFEKLNNDLEQSLLVCLNYSNVLHKTILKITKKHKKTRITDNITQYKNKETCCSLTEIYWLLSKNGMIMRDNDYMTRIFIKDKTINFTKLYGDALNYIYGIREKESYSQLNIDECINNKSNNNEDIGDSNSYDDYGCTPKQIKQEILCKKRKIPFKNQINKLPRKKINSEQDNMGININSEQDNMGININSEQDNMGINIKSEQDNMEMNINSEQKVNIDNLEYVLKTLLSFTSTHQSVDNANCDAIRELYICIIDLTKFVIPKKNQRNKSLTASNNHMMLEGKKKYELDPDTNWLFKAEKKLMKSLYNDRTQKSIYNGYNEIINNPSDDVVAYRTLCSMILSKNKQQNNTALDDSKCLRECIIDTLKRVYYLYKTSDVSKNAQAVYNNAIMMSNLTNCIWWLYRKYYALLIDNNIKQVCQTVATWMNALLCDLTSVKNWLSENNTITDAQRAIISLVHVMPLQGYFAYCCMYLYSRIMGQQFTTWQNFTSKTYIKNINKNLDINDKKLESIFNIYCTVLDNKNSLNKLWVSRIVLHVMSNLLKYIEKLRSKKLQLDNYKKHLINNTINNTTVDESSNRAVVERINVIMMVFDKIFGDKEKNVVNHHANYAKKSMLALSFDPNNRDCKRTPNMMDYHGVQESDKTDKTLTPTDESLQQYLLDRQKNNNNNTGITPSTQIIKQSNNTGITPSTQIIKQSSDTKVI